MWNDKKISFWFLVGLFVNWIPRAEYLMYNESQLSKSSLEALGVLYPKLGFSLIFYLPPLNENVVERDLAQWHTFGFFSFPFPFCLWGKGGNGRFIWLFTQIYDVPVYIDAVCMSICATQAQRCLYIHTLHMSSGPGHPKGNTLLPAALSLTTLDRWASAPFLILLGRFPSLSWQLFPTSSNPGRQQIVFLILKLTLSDSILQFRSFSTLGEGEKSLVKHSLY